jgi:pimeloyl-ACP methyl ester carboxylesterase
MYPKVNVVLIDLPGFGKSANPPHVWDVYEYVSFVRNHIEGLGIKSCDIVAHSFGARIATILAISNHELINRLVLVDPAGIERKDFMIQAKILTYKVFIKPWNVIVPEMFQISSGSRDYRSASPLHRQILSKVTNQNLERVLKFITQRTLVIWGQDDRELPVEYAKIYQRNIRNASVAVLSGAGHFPHLSQPIKFCLTLRNFLS